MDWEFIGESGGANYWHYITGKTTYVIVKDGETYMAFYYRGDQSNGHNYLHNRGLDCRTNPFSSFLDADRACGAKLRALRGV